jgi:hypothetical protein
MIWADRFAAGFAPLIVVFAILISLIAFNGATPNHAFTLSELGDTVVWTIKAEIYAALPMWAVLRIVDIVFGGRPRRSQKVS